MKNKQLNNVKIEFFFTKGQLSNKNDKLALQKKTIIIKL